MVTRFVSAEAAESAKPAHKPHRMPKSFMVKGYHFSGAGHLFFDTMCRLNRWGMHD
jgi:hypothetical protein